jgi:hypothetical protein
LCSAHFLSITNSNHQKHQKNIEPISINQYYYHHHDDSGDGTYQKKGGARPHYHPIIWLSDTKQLLMSKEDDPNKKFSDQQIFDMIRLHLSYYASTQPFCIAKDGPKRELKCAWLTAFHEDGICTAVAAFLMEFGKLNL